MSNKKDGSPIHIEGHYAFIPALSNRVGPFLFFGLTTVDEKLFVVISYNERFFSDNFITDLKGNFFKKLDELIE